MENQEAAPRFVLTPPDPDKVKKKRRWPPQVRGVEIAPLDKMAITVWVVAQTRRGEIKVPYVYFPETDTLRRVYPKSWRSLGVDKEGMTNVKNAARKKARKRHKKLIMKMENLGLIPDPEVD